MMTKNALTLPTPTEIEQAREALRALCQLQRGKSTLLRVEVPEGDSPVTALVPQSAFDLFLRVLGHMSGGEAIAIVPRHMELTTQEAADIMNVSRPYLIKLLEAGELPHRKIGRHRRIPAPELIKYMQESEKRSKETLDELTQLSETLGLY